MKAGNVCSSWKTKVSPFFYLLKTLKHSYKKLLINLFLGKIVRLALSAVVRAVLPEKNGYLSISSNSFSNYYRDQNSQLSTKKNQKQIENDRKKPAYRFSLKLSVENEPKSSSLRSSGHVGNRLNKSKTEAVHKLLNFTPHKSCHGPLELRGLPKLRGHHGVQPLRRRSTYFSNPSYKPLVKPQNLYTSTDLKLQKSRKCSTKRISKILSKPRKPCVSKPSKLLSKPRKPCALKLSEILSKTRKPCAVPLAPKLTINCLQLNLELISCAKPSKPSLEPKPCLDKSWSETTHLENKHKSFSRDDQRPYSWLRLLLLRGGDIKKNPGPDDCQKLRQADLLVTSYNVRGLNDEKKLRHLINKIYKEDKGKNCDYVVCLQETFIENEGKIPYLWRGSSHLTPGSGSSCGCLTLMSSHLNVLNAINIDNRAHVLTCQRSQDNEATYIIANLYAPNPNNFEKIEFFERVLDTVSEQAERYNCTKVIVAGDFNLIFESKEAKNRLYSAQERRVSDSVKELLSAGQLKDSWAGCSAFTWRRPNTSIFSTIDRIAFSDGTLELKKIRVDWSYGFSDHGAVIASYKIRSKTSLGRSKITRLDPSLATSPHFSPLIDQGVRTMLETMPPDWNPHLKLEFIKVCIRTVAEKIQAERKSFEVAEEKSLNEELDTAINKLSAGSLDGEENLIEYVEELRAKKQVMIEEKGARLAAKLGTKWFNEGEKSNRYFLRLLNRATPDDFEILQNENGEIVTTPAKIEEMIVRFYKELYEEDNNIIQDNDQSFFEQINPVTDQDDDDIAKEVTTAELLKTLQTCADSAPGPDGIPYSYLKLLWPIYGDTLKDAWHHSLNTKCLPPSHRVSFLKLIPKAGKDKKKLTNWRPITLSNCDHKIITKTYAIRVCERVASKINGGQTAYLKNRLINDNVRALLATINLTNLEDNTKGLLVALDAKKAFDSVSHKYIEKCLYKFGCKKFVPIFKTLYKDLKTDIIINGRITSGFKVNRGVKQGDALSCILFIMCMEPLLRNIEHNPEIEAINSATLGNLPKAYAYADDVNCVMADSERSMRALFAEYERLTLMSGLELNADKTELLRLGCEMNRSYNVSYIGAFHRIESVNEIKINGILFQRDGEALVRRNVETVIKKMDLQFKAWSRRSLSTLGKILIAKTFGISQAIYLLQSISLNSDHYKKLNAVLYKFIWNRHYLAAKAPERIKREIMTANVKNCGLGMLDIAELGDSLKLKALGRLRTSNHPFLRLLNTKLDLESYFEPKALVSAQLDGILTDGVALLKKDRNNLWDDPKLNGNCYFMSAIRNTGIKYLVQARGLNSIAFFQIWTSGARKVKDLRNTDLDALIRHIDENKIEKLRIAISLNIGPPDPNLNNTYYTGKEHKPLSSLTSKEIRIIRSSKKPIAEFKIGLSLTLKESLNWGHRVSKLTSTRHKNSLLRIAHGDVYTKDKLHRFGMADDNKCPRCDEVETLNHKFIGCPYVIRIWTSAKPFLEKLGAPLQTNLELTKIAMSSSIGSTVESMTLNAEILQTILYLKPEQNYLVHPRNLILNAIKSLATKEGNQKIKKHFIELLNETNSD